MFFFLMGILVYICFSVENFFCFLIGLEGLMVFLYGGITNMITCGSLSLLVGLIFMVMVVVEGAVGISILISSVSCYGEDYFFSLSVY